eukprot:15458931-Alexandrium_andersonii.AAC.1
MAAEGMASAFVQAFASLGGGGVHKQNIERDLHRWMRAALNITLEMFPLTLMLLPKTGVHVVPME